MAATQQAIDDTLNIVKDVGKFKKRIQERGDATAANIASAKKVKDDNKATFADRDAHLQEHIVKVDAAKGRLKSAKDAAATAMKPVLDAQAKLSWLMAKTDKRIEKLEQDQATLQAMIVDHDESVDAFNQKVERFESAVAAICKAVK
ncbi:MAG: hypothetical protein ABGX63_02600 [bacterium]|jgi:chromosome segregation ATPase